MSRRAPRVSLRRKHTDLGYSVRVSDVNGLSEDLRLDEDADRDAVLTAFSACTPFGHSLWQGARFVGWFAPGDSRIPAYWRLPDTPEGGLGGPR